MSLDTIDKDDDTEAQDAPAGRDDLDAEQKAASQVSQLTKTQQFDVLKKWFRADADHSREWRKEARDAYGFRAGEQWSPEDKALLDSRNRPHIVFNRVLTILKAVAGMEINGRHEISFIPRKTEDTKVNELLTAASKWMADNCDGEDEESQAFEDTLTCGMGWTEHRMNYEDDPEGEYVEESVDPLEMYWDRTARKKNLTDSRRMTRVRKMAYADAISLFPGKTRSQLDAAWADDYLGDYPERTLEDKRKRDTDSGVADNFDDLDEVTIVHTQWIEKEPYWLVADMQTNKKVALSEEEYKQFSKRMQTLMKAVPPDMAWQFEVHAVRLIRKTYKGAFLGGQMLQAAADSPIKGQFSWACITGERDKNKGSWFGLMRVMKDPQQWANKWLSQILHILNTTAKGGILAEEDAFEDQREAEESYAQSDTITYVSRGSLSGQKPKIIPKPGAAIADGQIKLMEFAINSIKDVTGINVELLGQRDENQPGIVEAMRKQAGMTVLATLFDSLRRFRKIVGRKRLYFIQNYLSDGRIIRVTGEETAQALPLLKDKTLGEYDVVVDDTPTSPNQKEANWAIIPPMLGIFKEQLMAQPRVLAILLEYSPLPSRLVDTIKSLIQKQEQDPDQQTDKNLQRQLIVSEITKNQSTAEMQDAKAGATQQTALYDFAMAKHLLESGDMEKLKTHLGMMESAAKMKTAQADTVKANADAEHSQAKAHRERVGTMLDVHDAAHAAADSKASHAHDAMGNLIDHLSAVAGAHRDMAGAQKDKVAAALAPHQAATDRMAAETGQFAAVTGRATAGANATTGARTADATNERQRAAARKDHVTADRTLATPIEAPGGDDQQ